MIRYNANSPEILGKTQYNVLGAFGLWCILLSVKNISLIVAGYSDFMTNLSFPIDSIDKIWNFLGPLSQIFDLALAVSLAVGILSRATKTASHIIFLVKMGFVLYICKLLIYLLNQNYSADLRSISQHLIFVAWTGFMLYILTALKKLFEQDCLIKHFNSPPKNDSSEMAPLVAAETNDNEVRMVTLFENWDPLYAYGTLLIITGFSNILTAMGLFSHELEKVTMSFYERLYFIYGGAALGAVVCLCGYGLRRRSEWGRMAAMLFHLFAFIVFCIMCALSIESSYIYYDYEQASILWSFIPFWLNLFVSLYWSYLVFFTLWSPIVKYVCLRNGYDID